MRLKIEGEIGDWDCGLGFEDWDCELGLESDIGIGDRDVGLGLEMGIASWT